MSTLLTTAGMNCAQLSARALPRLGRWRDRADVRIVVQANHLWVFWPAGDDAIARHILSLPGARLAQWHSAAWIRRDAHLPIFEVPDVQTAVTLDRVLAPESLPRETPSSRVVTPLMLHLVRGETPRKTTALRLSLEALMVWADSALTDDIEALEGAICDGEVLVLGRLPALHGERFWGQRLLIAAGWRPEPNLPENTLAEAIGLGQDHALWTPAGVEVVPQAALGPLSRAAIRLATGGRP